MWIPSLLVCFFFFTKLFLKLDSVLSNGFIVTIAFVFFSVGFLGLSNRKTVAMLCTKWVSPVQGYGVCAINYSICNNADMCRWSINLRFASDLFSATAWLFVALMWCALYVSFLAINFYSLPCDECVCLVPWKGQYVCQKNRINHVNTMYKYIWVVNLIRFFSDSWDHSLQFKQIPTNIL